jgi:sugar-specific transcriptional regulator TrmB
MQAKILEEIGLTDGESRIYIALLKLGSTTTGPIAKQSQISRSKVYFILDKLEKKGLVSHIDKNGVTYFSAVEPSKIDDYLRQKEDQFEKVKLEFKKFLPELQSYYTQNEKAQQVKVYQGLDGLKTAHEHIYLKLKGGEEYCYLGIPSHQPESQHRYWQRDHLRRVEAKIKCRLLFERGTSKEVLENRNSYSLSDARYMPIGIKTPAYFLIYKDTTMIAVPSDDPVVIEIVSQAITDSFKAYFNAFWAKSKPLK